MKDKDICVYRALEAVDVDVDVDADAEEAVDVDVDGDGKRYVDHWPQLRTSGDHRVDSTPTRLWTIRYMR